MIKILASFLSVKPDTLRFYFDSKSGIIGYVLADSPLKIIQTVAGFITPILMQKQIDLLTGGSYDQSSFRDFAFLLCASSLFSFLLSTFDTLIKWKTKKIKNNVSNYYLDKLLDHLGCLDSGKFHGPLGDLISETRDATNQQYQDILSFGSKVVSIPATIIGFLLVAKYVNSTMMIVIFAHSIISFGINFYRSELEKSNDMDIWGKNRYFFRIKNRMLNDFNDLNVQGKLPGIRNIFNSNRSLISNLFYEQQKTSDKIEFLDSILSRITDIGLAVFAGYLVFNGQMTVGAYTTYPTYNYKASLLVEVFSSVFTDYQEIKLNLRKLETVLELRSTVDFSGTEDISGIESIEFKSVGYHYEDLGSINQSFVQKLQDLHTSTFKDSKFFGWMFKLFPNNSYLEEEIGDLITSYSEVSEAKPVLKDMSFKLEAGDFVTVVGMNGCGKTTAFGMLSKALAPTNEQILINGEDIDIFNPYELKKQIISISQRQSLIRGLGLRVLLNFDNDPGVTDDKIMEVFKYLNLDLNLVDLDKIYGDDLELSGGQQQLVLMASLFLNKYKIHKSSVVILDEGTNKMDPLKKVRVIEGVSKYLDDCIVILVSHEMELCMQSDRILVFEDGRVTNEGTPDQLLSYDNLFSRFKSKKIRNKHLQLAA